MKKETLNFIQKYHMAEQGDGVIAGLSGGADSVCLLRILRCLRQELGIELRAEDRRLTGMPPFRKNCAKSLISRLKQ